MATVGGWLARLHDVEKKIKKTRAFGWKNRTEAGMVLSKAGKEKYICGAHPLRANETLCPVRATHTTRSRVSPGTIYSQGGRNTNDVSSNFLQKASAGE